LSVPIWIALGGVAAFFAGQGALWTFLETIGLASGIRAESVHTAMTVCAASGVCGAVAVIAMAERIGPLPPLIGSVALTVAAVTVIQSRSPWIYTASISAFYFCLPIFAAYQFGVIAGADRSGHAAVLTSSATFGGFAVAPYLGGQLAERFGYGSLQLLDGGMMFAASLTLLALCGTWNRSL
jgi:DHA1 family inner membrane transport protein